MKNQNQFVRQTAAALLACGLIASLLPGFLVATEPARKVLVSKSAIAGKGSVEAQGDMTPGSVIIEMEAHLRYSMTRRIEEIAQTSPFKSRAGTP